MRTFERILGAAAAVALAAASWTAMPAEARAPASAPPILIGASVPISGVQEAFGTYLSWGYRHAVDQVNAAGGIVVDGQRRPVRLVLLDDESNPSVSATNAQRLILEDHVAGLVSSCTAPLVNPEALVAERLHVPMVADCDPIELFEAPTHGHWRDVWDLFFANAQYARNLPFTMLGDYGVKTNRRAALLTDDTPGGQGFHKAWLALLPKLGYRIVAQNSFAVGTTDFGSAIVADKLAKADVLLVFSDTPTAVDIVRSIHRFGYRPKVVEIVEGAEPQEFARAAGCLANGVLVGGYWSPHSPYPGAAALAKDFEAETHLPWSQHIGDSYAAMMVLLKAIAAAHSLAPGAIEAAIARTNWLSPVGPIDFARSSYPHAAALPLTEDQWQNGSLQVVWPHDRATASFVFPYRGCTPAPH